MYYNLIMKRTYFKLSNIDKVSKRLLLSTANYKRHRRFDFKINESALLVIDVQKYFTERGFHAYIPSSKAVIVKINELIRFFNEKKRPVIYTKHINSKENAGMLNVFFDRLIEKNTKKSEFSDSLLIKDNSIIIEKTQYNAFYKTELENILNKKNVKQIVITGFMTHLCCETTAREGFVRGFHVFFPVDCSASYNIKYHKATLLNLSHGFATLVLSEEILREKYFKDL